MTGRRVKGFVVAVAVVLLGWPAAVGAQGADDGFAAPRTAWGDPDLMGIWDFRTMTPLQRPAELAGKAQFTSEEAAAYEAERVVELDKDVRPTAEAPDLALAYNDFWWDYGKELVDDNRTSLIVDPADGRIPATTAKADQRAAARRESRTRGAWGPEDRSVGERCILGFNAGPPMSPSAYNNNVQIFQSPGYVVLLIEMVHDARIVPLDGQSPLPADVRQWRGDSRGHWDGDTLVIETRNFTGNTPFQSSSPDMTLTERLTRVGSERVLYEYTIDDPGTFVASWTAAVPMKRTEQPLFEYACHEGNYGMTNLLAGARVEEIAK
jgi:hypothetical protein